MFGLVNLNWWNPSIRFSIPALNYLFLLASFTLPWFALFSAFHIGRRWVTIAVTVVLLPALAYTLFWGLFVCIDTAYVLLNGIDPSFEAISRVDMGSYEVALYRTNGGAMTSFGIAVRQEKSVLLGLRIVRQLEGFYPADAATYRVLGPDVICVEVPPYGDKAGRRSATYHLNRSVYF